MKIKKVLVAGAAGFIGAKVSEFLARGGVRVVGIDNLNGYYDIRLKKYRLHELKHLKTFSFYRVDILNHNALEVLFRNNHFDAVINLAAQAGVACSVQNPYAYLSANTLGTLHLLELSREFKVPKYFLSSTSSVYAGHGGPFSETFSASAPLSPYAASKKAAEVFCHAYHHLHGLDVIIARYFTVYGPAGRPDMAPFKFIQSIRNGKPISVYGNGKQTRDFTYIDDIARGTIESLRLRGYQIINFGSDKPVKLLDFISRIEKQMEKKAVIKIAPPVKADAKNTWANVGKAKRILGWIPQISLDEGIRRTVLWYLQNEKWASRVKPGYNAKSLRQQL